MKTSLVLCLAAVSVFSVAQDKPEPPKVNSSEQKGAVPGQTKVDGENLKALPKKSANGANLPPINGHSVTMHCGASTSAGVTGYNFYSGPTKGSESTTPLNNTPATTCDWIDGTVIGTNTYWYFAKAFCPTCVPPLSDPSNEIGPEVIPPDGKPLPPSGLAVVGTVTQNSIPLQWTAPAAQGNYDLLTTEIYRGSAPTLPNAVLVAIVPATTHSYNVPFTCAIKTNPCYFEVKSYALFNDASYQLSDPSNIVKVVLP